MDFRGVGGRGQSGRCLGQFALTIYDNTKREKLLMESWFEMVSKLVKPIGFTHKNYKLASFVATGVDNSGKLLIDSKSGKADYTLVYHRYVKKKQVSPDPETRLVDWPELEEIRRGLEVKFTGQFKKLTYKVADLESYIKQDALVLTIVSDGMVGPNGNPDSDVPLVLDTSKLKWFLMDAPLMQRMLETIPIHNHFEMGRKPSVQLLQKDFSDYLDIKDWI